MKALKPKEIHLILVGWQIFVGVSDAAEAEKHQVQTQVRQSVVSAPWIRRGWGRSISNASPPHSEPYLAVMEQMCVHLHMWVF